MNRKLNMIVAKALKSLHGLMLSSPNFVLCVSFSFWMHGSVNARSPWDDSKATKDIQASDSQPRPANDLKVTIEQTLESNLNQRILSDDRNGAWQVIHGAVAYGDDLPLEVNGNAVPAIAYLLDGGKLQGWELSVGPVLPSTGRPGVIARVESGSFIGQGHSDQWLGYFSQIPLPLDRAVTVEGQKLTLLDWARQAQYDVPNNPYLEYSWTLIALTNFFPNEKDWVASDGKSWTLEPLVRFEAQQDLSDSACGGMHRLMGLAHAVRYRNRLQEPMDQGWGLAKSVVENAIDSARKFQSSDGSFSTNYTSRPGTSADLSSTISATGHTLEFLSYALSSTELEKQWMERAVLRLCAMLKASEKLDMECGGTYHALAGLNLYHKRRFSKP
jgi:hypothetical protein